MKQRFTISIFLLVLFAEAAALPAAKVTIRVIDENGDPIDHASVGAGFSKPKGEGKGWGSNYRSVTGLTDSEGLFEAEGETEPYVGLSAKKDGYYSTGGRFSEFTSTTGMLGFRKYEPWNPTITLELKKIINPIPMYAVRMSGMRDGEYPETPVTDRFVGYDLTANDWVVPYGLGTHKDFLFKVAIARAKTYLDYDVTLTLKFTNQGDGLIKYTPDLSKGKSALRTPYHAPVSGYESELIRRYESSPDVMQSSRAGNPDYDVNYFFRIRTELDKDGNVIGGLYGKIYGEIDLGNFAWLHNSKPFISFNYYLNPNNNDTNIEFDPEKNLFKGIPDRLKVGEP